MRLSTPKEREEAAEMRARNLSYGQIAYRLGRDWTTIYRWLNPEAQRKNRERARRWRKRKPASARRSRRASYHRTVAQGAYGRCKHCDGPLRGKRRTRRNICLQCLKADREFLYREIQQRWAVGESVEEIAEGLRREIPAITGYIRTMRENGWDMPYRRLDQRRLTSV